MTQERPRITMFRTSGCPFCVAAERLLREQDVPFDQVFLDDHPDRRGFVAEKLPGHRTVPLIVIDGEPIGGFEELQALVHSGRFGEMLQRS